MVLGGMVASGADSEAEAEGGSGLPSERSPMFGRSRSSGVQYCVREEGVSIGGLYQTIRGRKEYPCTISALKSPHDRTATIVHVTNRNEGRRKGATHLWERLLEPVLQQIPRMAALSEGMLVSIGRGDGNSVAASRRLRAAANESRPVNSL